MSVKLERKPFSVPELWAGSLALAAVALIAFGGLRVVQSRNALPPLARYASVSIPSSEASARLSLAQPLPSPDLTTVAGDAPPPDVRAARDAPSPDVRQDTGNAAPIAANEDALRPSVVDRRPVAAAAPVEAGTERHEANVPELTAAIWAPTPGPPRESRLADSQRRNVSAPVSDAGFVGSWTDDVGKCRNGRKAPIVISSRTAKTAIGGCDFGLVTREAANRWRVTARCALEGKVWRANIALKLTEPNLTWSSERGTATYVRCGR